MIAHINYKEQLPVDFSKNSRVWIYQASRTFFLSEALQLEEMLNQFVKEWKSHGSAVKAYANLFFGQFIILIADETQVAVGGCSTDSSVHFIKKVEQQFSVELLNRQLLAFIRRDKIELIPLSQLDYAIANHFIDGDTLYFNNAIGSLQDLENNWIIPVKKSWLSRQLKDKA